MPIAAVARIYQSFLTIACRLLDILISFQPADFGSARAAGFDV